MNAAGPVNEDNAIIYAVIPHTNTTFPPLSYCGASSTVTWDEYGKSLGGPFFFSPGGTPNQTAADQTVMSVSHEFFESVTDPFAGDDTLGAWEDLANKEIADKCANMRGVFLKDLPNGGNVYMQGNWYLVPEIWSQAFQNGGDSSCALGGTTVRISITTGNDELASTMCAYVELDSPDETMLAYVPLKDCFGPYWCRGQHCEPSWPSKSFTARVFPFVEGLKSGLGQVAIGIGPVNDGVLPSPYPFTPWTIDGGTVEILTPEGKQKCAQPIPGHRFTSPAPVSAFTIPTPGCH